MMSGDLLDNHGRGEAGWTWPSIHPEGRRIGLVVLATALFVLLILGWAVLGWLLLFAATVTFAAFRDPERVVPLTDSSIVSPADGQVAAIGEAEVPHELIAEDGSGSAGLSPGRVIRISIFTSFFHVYINRAPIGGSVQRVIYAPGHLLNIGANETDKERERQHILIASRDGTMVGITQVAGLIARQIVPFVKKGDMIAAGQRVGLVRFGSRVDVYLPHGTDPLVIKGQQVVAGETLLARSGETQVIKGRRQ